MRDKLAGRAGQRLPYVARLKLYGVSHLQGERRRRRGTALMTWVHDYDPGRLRESERRGAFLTMHVWVPDAAPFVLAGVERGQTVSFTAIAAPYLRGPHGLEREEDYNLTGVGDVVVVATQNTARNAEREGGQRGDRSG